MIPLDAARVVPVADRAVLVEFGDEVTDDTIAAVRRFDRRLTAVGVPGLVEVVPSGVNALVVFDPLVTDHATVIGAVEPLLGATADDDPVPELLDLEVRYDPTSGPDLAEVARRSGMDTSEVVAAHTAPDYRVVMFGFAPGAPYLRSVDERIRLPRKPTAVRDVPAGSVIIAGEQCLLMTVTMPTGWWVIGRVTDLPALGTEAGERWVDVGDLIRFHPAGAAP